MGVNRVGRDGNGVEYGGGSAVYDYEGAARVEIFDAAQLAVVEIDKADLDTYRAAFPAWQDADEFEVKV